MRDGFGAEVVITPDPIWKARRGAPTRSVPSHAQSSVLRVGGKIWALIFLKNPLQDPGGIMDVTCDVRTIRPNGKVTEHREVRALKCKGTGATTRTYLAEFVVTMSGAEDDPIGEWVLEILVRDRNRGIEVPVVGRFTLLPKDRRIATLGAGRPRG